MKKAEKKNRIRCGRSERGLKITAVVISLLFAALMVYPMLFAVSSSMKDNAKIYEVPPKLLPASANSLSVVLDYSGMEFTDDSQLKDTVLRDNILTMFGTNFKMADDSIMEIHVYGVKDGVTVFHSRAHQMKLQMERDYGVYKSTAIKSEVLLHGDRYVRAAESIGYEFDTAGIGKEPPQGLDNRFGETVASLLSEKYQTTGRLASVWDKEIGRAHV